MTFAIGQRRAGEGDVLPLGSSGLLELLQDVGDARRDRLLDNILVDAPQGLPENIALLDGFFRRQFVRFFPGKRGFGAFRHCHFFKIANHRDMSLTQPLSLNETLGHAQLFHTLNENDPSPHAEK